MFAIMIILRLLNNFFFNNNISYAWEEYEKIVVDIHIFFDLIK